MFWNKIKSKEYSELLELINRQSVRVSSLELDLALYVKKLKASKGISTTKIEEEETSQDLYGGMFLGENGHSQKHK